MGVGLVFTEPRTVGYVEEEERDLATTEVRVQTLYSGISAGTELTAYRGSNPYLHKQWDGKRRLFVPKDIPSLEYPLTGWGYEEVGDVVEVGSEVTEVKVGDRIHGAWGHCTHHILEEEYAAPRLYPATLDPILGIFSHLGSIAINGVHDAKIRIGETVAVFGLGALGQIVAQLAKQSGARVVGVDLLDKRLALAQELNAIDLAINAGEGEAAEQIKAMTNNRGVDVALEVTGAPAALNEAVRSTAYSARVVAMGFFQVEAQGLYLGEEFHHNRISIVCSQISGVAPDLSYRWNRVRLAQTVMQLQLDGLLNLRPLITHIEPFERAKILFEALDKTPDQVVQAVMDFSRS
ncbi:MAG: zinc-binding dehydrogenase [Candidatus Promineifilaceae bacterium]|nr:zinc-binding dehydrogenase [Candidatus Promineifilaceae bacterium]